MPHRLPRRARPAPALLGIARGVLLTSVVVAGWLGVAASHRGGVPPVVERHARDAGLLVTDPTGREGRLVDRALAEHRCSTSGFADDRAPRSALVRTAGGRLRHVSFDAGWRALTAQGSSRLLAVCLDPPPHGRAGPRRR